MFRTQRKTERQLPPMHQPSVVTGAFYLVLAVAFKLSALCNRDNLHS